MLTEFKLVFLLIGPGFVQGTYKVTEETGFWHDPWTDCTLATPDIVYDSGVPQLARDENITSLVIEHKEQFWIGYYKAFGLFQYNGCVEKANIFSNGTKNDLSLKTIGDCYSACGYSLYIAVGCNSYNELIQCKCADAIGGIFNVSTNTWCNINYIESNHNVLPCVSEDGGVFAVYQAAGESTDKRGDMQCQYRDVEDVDEWKDCGQFFCTGSLPKRHTYKQHGRRKMEKKKDSQSTDSDVAYTCWTGLVRSKVIYTRSVDSFNKPNNTDRKYAYLENDDGDVKISFQERGKRRAICDTESKTTVYTSTESQGTPSRQVTGKGESGNTALIAISITAIVVLIAVITLVIMWKRGHYPFSRKDNTTDQGKIPTHQSDPHCSYKSVEEQPSVNDTHNYFVLERQDMTEIKRSSHFTTGQMPNNTPTNEGEQTDEEENQYHTVDDNVNADIDSARTLAPPQHAMGISENVYNKLDLEDENEYDHTMHTENRNLHQVKQEDNYNSLDTITHAHPVTDNVYNTLANEEHYQSTVSNLTATTCNKKALENDYDTTNSVR